MPTVSIIMPVYNKEKYVRKSIISILDQSYTDFELLVINDGSTDNSLSICLELQEKDNRIKVISVENGGVSKARNIGLDNAKGKYVMFIDSDDYIAKNYLIDFVMNKNDFVLGGLTKTSKEGKEISVVLPNNRDTMKINEVAKDFYDEQLKSGIYGFVASKLISLELINKYQIRFDETIKLAEDYNFFLDVYSKIHEITFIDQKGYYYIQETDNSAIVMDDSKIDFYQQIDIQNKVKNFLVSKNAFSLDNENKYNQLLTGYVYTILLKSSILSVVEFRKKFKSLKKKVLTVDKNCTGLMKLIIHLYEMNKVDLIYYLLRLKKALVR